MRTPLGLLALPALVAAAPADYARTIVATPEGGFRIGNPAARVKLIEYASLTCPHCRAFHVEGSAALKRDYIARGLVSYELRNMVLNGPDFAASVLARCQSPAAFFRSVDAFYRLQQQWLAPFGKLTDADNDAIAKLPEAQKLAAVARLGKLDAFVATQGMPRAVFDKCLADPAAQARLIAIGDVAAKQFRVVGTPTFLIDGNKVETNTWAGIEPLLKAALGKISTARK